MMRFDATAVDGLVWVCVPDELAAQYPAQLTPLTRRLAHMAAGRVLHVLSPAQARQLAGRVSKSHVLAKGTEWVADVILLCTVAVEADEQAGNDPAELVRIEVPA